MANKRFLGLGFTFAAQDKGLLKTLKAVQGTLSSITESLNEINGVGKTASGTLGKIKMRGSSKGQARAPKAQPIKKDIDRKKATFAELTKESLFSKDDAAFFTEIKKSLNERGFKTFVQDFNSLNKDFDESKNLTSKFKQELAKYAVAAFEATDGTAKLQKSFKGFFKAFSTYAKDVGMKTKAFIETLGVDLSSIIPPQLTALGGLIGTLVSPIAKLGKSLSQSLFPSKAEKLQRKLLSQIGGSGRGEETVFGKLKKLVELQSIPSGDKSKDGGGFLGKVMGVFSGLGQGLMGLLGLKSLGPILDKLKTLPALLGKGVTGLFKFATKLGPKALGPLAGVVSAVTSLMSGESLTKAGSKGVGATIGGFIGGALGTALGPVGMIIGSTLGGVAGDFLGGKVGDFFDKGGGKELAKLPSMLSEAFSNFISYLGSLIKEIPNMAKNLFSDLSTKAGKGIKSFFGFDDNKKSEVDSVQRDYAAPADKKFIIESAEDPHGEKQVTLMSQLVSETKRTNDLQTQMISALEKKNGVPAPVNTVAARSFRSDPQNQFLSEGAF